MSGIFVGREGELATLGTALERACQGTGQLVLVRGEPGIGKTTLVERFCASATTDSDVRVLWGSCWDGGGQPVYWPWIQVLRAAAHAGGGQVIDALGDRLAPLGLDPSRPGPGGSPVERFALFDAVTQVLHVLAGPVPL